MPALPRFPTPLIDVDHAVARVAAACPRISDTLRLPLAEALGRVLAATIAAPHALPTVTQSAMDGFALTVGAGLAAGSVVQNHWPVVTGAPLPAGADAVILGDFAQVTADGLVLHRAVAAGDNIRRAGEDITAGEPLVAADTRLQARHLGLLAMAGVSMVEVRRAPRLDLRALGDREGEASATLAVLEGLARSAGVTPLPAGSRTIDPSAPNALAETNADLIVLAAGVDVGGPLGCVAMLEAQGFTVEPMAIALKPGKPLVLATHGRAVALVLPGHPVPALITWMLLVRPMLAALEGGGIGGMPPLALPAATLYRRRPGRTEFAPARLVDGRVEILGRGGSVRFRPLLAADGLAEIDAGTGDVAPGHLVRFHALAPGA
ncbi:MAG: molybdopterin molybdenumtransferase MoeA [Alphaproteobacteria bacterium]|nr:molybdopterin molybdenumtransferase MoeA [Alphaproteobacteria bacterium]